MSAIQVVGLGMATVDILFRLRELPTWTHGARLHAAAIQGGGPVATALCAVSRLGVRAGYVGVCGGDRMGEIKMQTLVEFGLDLSHMVKFSTPEGQVVLVNVHAETGERVFSGLDSYSDNNLKVQDLDQGYITSAEYLHLDGFHAEAALQAARWMHAAGKKVMLDGSATRGPLSPTMKALVQEADILICGCGFGAALTGLDDPWQIGEAILQVGPSVVVQTEGKEGSYTVSRQERFHTPAFTVEVVDTTGAGDVFHGAYLVGLLRGWDLRSVALFSSAVSALKCAKLGGRSGIPTFEETLAFLAGRGIAMPL